MTTYNGWTNRATWNAKLWLDNDELYYRAIVELVRATPDSTELTKAVARMCHGWWGGMTPDKAPLDDVNWQEIVTALREENAGA